MGGVRIRASWFVPGAKAAGLTTKAGFSRLGGTWVYPVVLRSAPRGTCPGLKPPG